MTERWTEAMVLEYQRKMKEAARVMRFDGTPQTGVTVRESKPSKYRNRKTADGFDSEKERDEWLKLQAAEKAGNIRNLRRQVAFACVVNGIHVCDYKADMVFEEDGRTVVVDIKSAHTRTLPMYRLKKKLMLACNSIQIQEVL